MLAILRAGGLPPRLAVQGYLVLIATVNGFTVDETGVEDSGAPDRDPAHLAEAADRPATKSRRRPPTSSRT